MKLFEMIATRAMLVGLLAALFVPGMAGCSNTAKPTAKQEMKQKADAAQMVAFGGEKMNTLLSYDQTEAIKNMLGGARGIFMAPYMSGEAALIGTEQGTGYLMRRHGKEWSDPVFLKLTGYSLGYQAGVKESHMIILLMTDTAVDDFVKGKMELGGKGGFAVGTLGMGASGAGGIKGGLELLIISTNQGIFLGGGMSAMSLKTADAINDDIYGKNANLTEILAGNGGRYAPADKVRSILSEMVVHAWGPQAK